MARPAANLRLFVAAYAPMDLVALWRSAVAACGLPAHRLVPAEQVHLTLQFIGDTPSRELDDVIESIRRAAGGLSAFELAARELIRLPERGPARLIALETDAPPTLLELQRRLAVRLARNVHKRPGKKFRPHFTLCRFRSPTRLSAALEAQLARSATRAFPITHLHLMRSTLKPEGAEHIEVEAFKLD